MTDLRALADESFCYLTTTGRVTGRSHEIEIWFSLVPETRALYMLSGGGDRSDWVKNLSRDPDVEVRIAGKRYSGRVRGAQDAEDLPGHRAQHAVGMAARRVARDDRAVPEGRYASALTRARLADSVRA